ncbi:hypothetical protein [Fibrisoma limi]|uniref:hypothetical protein n=1 Tax=Fibrisoma limi TaxID=663275 RepID=UPI0005868DEF|nr:hypothetical protein [Fibrisoma limi]
METLSKAPQRSEYRVSVQKKSNNAAPYAEWLLLLLGYLLLFVLYQWLSPLIVSVDFQQLRNEFQYR